MDYKQKYLKYKKKYMELQNIINHTKILSGGGPVLPWFPLQSNQLYIEAVINLESFIGSEYKNRYVQSIRNLLKLGQHTPVKCPEFHVTLLEVLIPETRTNIGPKYIDTSPNINKLHIDLKNNLKSYCKKIKGIYNDTLGNAVAYSDKDNYTCYGQWFVRKYDNNEFLQKIVKSSYDPFKNKIIDLLLNNKPTTTVLYTSMDSTKKIIKKFTHYYDTQTQNFLPVQMPGNSISLMPPNNTQYISNMAISHYFDSPNQTGISGWTPHISIDNIPSCTGSTASYAPLGNIDIADFHGEFIKNKKNPLSLLTFWKFMNDATKLRNIKDPRNPKNIIKLDGSILKLVIKYSYPKRDASGNIITIAAGSKIPEMIKMTEEINL